MEPNGLEHGLQNGEITLGKETCRSSEACLRKARSKMSLVLLYPHSFVVTLASQCL